MFHSAIALFRTTFDIKNAHSPVIIRTIYSKWSQHVSHGKFYKFYREKKTRKKWTFADSSKTSTFVIHSWIMLRKSLMIFIKNLNNFRINACWDFTVEEHKIYDFRSGLSKTDCHELLPGFVFFFLLLFCISFIQATEKHLCNGHIAWLLCVQQSNHKKCNKISSYSRLPAEC